jgi:NAD(P)-dependent dehydrogenase (short-subunit alcohol dehydrogenase family)
MTTTVARRQPGSGVSFVTGGANGIGRAIVGALAARGDTVFLADLDVGAAEAAVGELVARGFDVRACGVDVTDVESLTAAIETADRAAPLTTLVNNAGVGFATSLFDTTPERFDHLMAVNLRASFFGLQAAARVMRPRRAGAIVNLSSTSGFASSSSPMLAYDVSKGAIRRLTASAARELAPVGIRVNAVAPGTIDAGITLALTPERAALDDLVARRIPLGRLGTTDDIAAAVVWLTSPAAGYVTGHTLVVDGGRLT